MFRHLVLTTIFLLGISSIVIAHGHDEGMSMAEPEMGRPTLAVTANVTVEPTYFTCDEHSGLMMAHILLMIVAWVFVLPISVMLSIARSRYTLPVQFVFGAINAIGIFFVTIHNANAPDLYPNNAHHKLGWILTWTVMAQVVMGVIAKYSARKHDEPVPVSADAMAQHLRRYDLENHRPNLYRFSNDSGQGTEPNTESLRSHSLSSQGSDQLPQVRGDFEEEAEPEEKHGLIGGSSVDKFMLSRIPGMFSSRALKTFQFFYDAVDRLILILGFVALTTGGVTYGGFFIGSQIFSGLAHFIKGGVFFWYGILTLGRWAGCFAEIGWAWNVKPNPPSKSPSAEFVESFLIFFYGITNVFLEHLASWGSAWSAQDLEHISITIMFFGGGLCGMLVESRRIRDLLNATKHISAESYYAEPTALEEPKSYPFPMNPIPALIIFLLGLMMSSHHQSSMVATMIHSQWGTLLVAAAFARGASYIVFYLAPPTSILPGRPPTELITAFCLMAGGFIFMASSSDTVMAMEANDINAMFIFTVTMGLIAFLMAWIIAVIAIKGAAVRRQNKDMIAQFGLCGVA